MPQSSNPSRPVQDLSATYSSVRSRQEDTPTKLRFPTTSSVRSWPPSLDGSLFVPQRLKSARRMMFRLDSRRRPFHRRVRFVCSRERLIPDVGLSRTIIRDVLFEDFRATRGCFPLGGNRSASPKPGRQNQKKYHLKGLRDHQIFPFPDQDSSLEQFEKPALPTPSCGNSPGLLLSPVCQV
jgi:hypothetical protein